MGINIFLFLLEQLYISHSLKTQRVCIGLSGQFSGWKGRVMGGGGGGGSSMLLNSYKTCWKCRVRNELKAETDHFGNLLMS